MANRRTSRPTGRVIENDNLAPIFDGLGKDIVPAHLRGSDQYLDIICWNIRYFNQRDPERTRLIASIMAQLNADIFVCEEIEDGALDPVAEMLIQSGAGLYKTAYGTTGGDQRVAVMYDTEWVKAKEDIGELFSTPPVIADNGKKAFPRLPLHSVFVGRSEQPAERGPRREFDFHLVGLHLKSQRPSGGDDGRSQRASSATRLSQWLKHELGDEPDAILLGDWNAKPSKPEWKEIRDLEDGEKVVFAGWNSEQEASHFYRSGQGTRLDLVLLTMEASKQSVEKGARVIPWEGAFGPNNRLALLIDKISDHFPVLSRFYFLKE